MLGDQLFKKAVTFTDLHFGRSNNAPLCNQDNIGFLEWAIDRAKAWGAETCLVLGDYFDNRHSCGLATLDAGLKGMEMISKAFEHVVWIPGNHDLMYRDKRDISSVVFARLFNNITFVTEPTTLGGCTVLPWLVGDEPREIREQLDSRYVFGHLELPGFLLNAKVPMPHHANGITADDFIKPEYVFSGHFHFRQKQGRVVYTGNIMPFNFADDWDEDRGMMLLEWGKDPIFEAWPDQPLFRTMKLSDMLSRPDFYLKPNMTVRASLDLPMTYEETMHLRDEFVKSHQLRKLETVTIADPNSAKAAVKASSLASDAAFQTVDQIVYKGLDTFESHEIDSAFLKEIYASL